MSDQTNAAVAEPEVAVVDRAAEQQKAAANNKRKPQPRYHVILWNDNDHSYEYVMVMMRELFALPVERGFQIAFEVDKSGRSVCLTTTREHAELKMEQIHAFGSDPLIPRCKGSMSATIEPVPA
ncbi:MAG TPA: ATP-dependent Clp protease adaptor ClpS [Pirellulaceae bacterium]|nr:ATP-dependent Clp protease adaptor ClpS [Pirellulaceae bacterium]